MRRALLLLTLAVPAIAHAEKDEEPIQVLFNGVELDLPGNLNMRGSFFSAQPGTHGGGYGEITAEFMRLMWSGPALAYGQQERNLGFRFGLLPLTISRLAFGGGVIWDITTVGVPTGWKIPDDHDAFNAVGVEATVVMDLMFHERHGEFRELQVVGHAGYEVGFDHLRRPVFEAGLVLTPFASLPFLQFDAHAIYSKFDYGASPASSGDVAPRARMQGTDVLFGVGYNMKVTPRGAAQYQ